MLSLATDSTVKVFSTRGLPSGDRVEFSREVFGRKIIQLEIEAAADAPVEIEAKLRSLPGLRIYAGSQSRFSFNRTRELAADGDADIALMLNLAGRGLVRHCGREMSLRAGDATLISHAEPSIFDHSRNRFVALVASRRMLAELVVNIDDSLGLPLEPASDALRLLRGYFPAVLDDLALGNPELSHLVSTHILDLIALSIGASREGSAVARGRGLRAARLRAIKADIVENLSSRTLGVASIAARHRVSPRYVHMLFEEGSDSFSRFVLKQRLGLVHRMLADPRNCGRTIADLAYEAGFGDLSYFNLVFRRRYGVTPSDVRRRAPR
jgi:AraC-like DNA-binding protein